MLNPNTFPNMAEFYLAQSQAIIDLLDNPLVLKTDLYNEEKALPKPGGVIGNLVGASHIHGIEYDEQRIFRAREKLQGAPVSCRQGDIRALPYDDVMFDLVLDLSTIDHVWPPEMHKVIAQYARVLKGEGVLLLIAWTYPAYCEEKFSEYNPNNQYYFSRDMVHAELRKYFDIIDEQIASVNNGKELVAYIAKKRPLEA